MTVDPELPQMVTVKEFAAAIHMAVLTIERK
jgi:hypothetical protein